MNRTRIGKGQPTVCSRTPGADGASFWCRLLCRGLGRTRGRLRLEQERRVGHSFRSDDGPRNRSHIKCFLVHPVEGQLRLLVPLFRVLGHLQLSSAQREPELIPSLSVLWNELSAHRRTYAAPFKLASESLITNLALSRATSVARPAVFTESSTASKSL